MTVFFLSFRIFLYLISFMRLNGVKYTAHSHFCIKKLPRVVRFFKKIIKFNKLNKKYVLFFK